MSAKTLNKLLFTKYDTIYSSILSEKNKPLKENWNSYENIILYINIVFHSLWNWCQELNETENCSQYEELSVW